MLNVGAALKSEIISTAFLVSQKSERSGWSRLLILQKANDGMFRNRITCFVNGLSETIFPRNIFDACFTNKYVTKT